MKFALSLLLAAAATAAAMPQPSRRDVASTITTSPTSPTVTFGPEPTSCDLRFCSTGTLYCMYWAGYTSYDISQHKPVPGETLTKIGLCNTTSTTTTSVTASATGSMTTME